MKQTITHEAVVKSIDNERICVSILQPSACSGCAAKQMCNSAEAKEKQVEVFAKQPEQYSVGQKVVLEGQLTDGRKAAMIAYGLPLILMLPVLFFAVYITGSETEGALWSLATVAAYFAVVALFFRKRLQRQFSFHLRTI